MLCGLLNSAPVNAQQIQSGTGAPAQNIEVSNGPRQFMVTVLVGAISSATLSITLPAGFEYVSGSATGASPLTVSETSVSAGTATLSLGSIPAAGTNATFTYQVRATCAAIGTAGNQASYILTPSGSSAQPERLSNAFNLTNAKINITNLANTPATAGVVGDSYTRSFRINNNGFGNIDTVYVTDLSGNGVAHLGHSVSASSGGSTVTADLISSTVSGSNTTYLYRFIISNSPQDNHLGQNEYFTFTQNLRIDACSNLNTSLNAWYGTGPNPVACAGQNDTQTTALAIDNSKQPALTIASVLATPTTCRGVATPQEFKVTNTGTAAAKDILLRLFHTNSTTSSLPGTATGFPQSSQKGYVPGSFKYRIGASGTYNTVPIDAASGVTITNQVNYTVSSCLNTTAPDRLDLVIPDLAVGQEIYFQYEEISCCYTECSSANDAGSMVRSRYSNQCGAQVGNTLNSGNAVNLRNNYFESGSLTEDFPTDIIPGNTYNLKWETTGINYPTTIYPLGSTVRYEVTLPAGLVYDGSAISMRTKDGTTATPASVSYTGNTLKIAFVTGTGGFTLANVHNKGILSVNGISLDCASAAGSVGNVNTKLFYKNASCSSCEQQVFCGDQSISLHCPAPCPAGMANNNFVVTRKNFNLPDNLNNGTANGSTLSGNVRTNWVSRGDTLSLIFHGTVLDGGVSAHNFKYGYARFTIPDATAQHFTALSATVKITDATGTVVKANLANYPVNYAANASNGSALVDYSIDKLVAAGVTGYSQFTDTDKVTITVMLKVTNGIGGQLSSPTVSTDFYLSDAANPSGSVASDKWSCDNFSGTFTLLGMMPYSFGAQTMSGQECSTITATGSLGYVVGANVNNGGPGINFYTDEFRRLGVPGNYTITVPAGYNLESITFSYIRGGSNYSQVTSSVVNPVADGIAGQVYTYNMRKLFTDQGGSWPLPDEGFYVNFSAVLRPTCEAPATAILPFSLQILPGTDMKETLPPAGFTPSVSNNLSLVKSNLVVNAASPVQTVTGNTVTWEVQIANTQPGTSPNIWMAENNGTTNGLTIQSVEPITAFGGAVSGAAFSPTAGIYQLGTYGQESRYYRVTATFTNCDQDVMPMAVGYVCGNYPASVDAALCKNITNLTVIPTDAALQVSLTGQPAPTYPDYAGAVTGTNDLCEQLEYTAEVKNPAQGTAYDLKFTVAKPGGVAYVANSYQLSPAISPASVSLAAVNNDAAYVSETATELIFTIPASVVASLPYNQGYTIRYRVKTVACDFVSGTKMSLQAKGKNGCGSATTGTQQQTQTIRIKGENPNPNSYTISSLVSAPIQACSTASTSYTFTAVNNGPVATYAGETVRIALPKPLTFGNTVTGINNFPSGATPVPTSDATHHYYTWTLPAGVPSGATISFSANIVAVQPELLSCGVFPISELIAYTFTSSCVPSGTVCLGSLQTEGQNTATTVAVTKPDLEITGFTGAQNAARTLTGTLTLVNHSTDPGDAMPQDAVLTIYKDTNGNSVIDGGDTQIGTQAVTIQAGAAQTINYNVATTYVGNLCPALVALDVECACTAPAVFLYTGCEVPMPVTLKEFEAREWETGVKLSWTTSTESNSAKFQTQRSEDAQDWVDIGTLKAAENSATDRSYSFIDHAPLPGSNYYRLQMVDMDKTFAYSRIAIVKIDAATGRLLYPNPVLESATLDLGDKQIATQLEVINSKGVTVISVNRPVGSSINMSGLASGMYVVKVKLTTGKVLYQKLMKK